MTEKTACTGRLLWTRLEADYSPENKNGFQVAHVTGLSAEDIAIVEKMVTPWDYKTPVRSVALPGERIAVARFTALERSFGEKATDLYRRMFDKSYRGGIYIADVRVYDAPRWRHIGSMDDVRKVLGYE